MDLLEVDGEEHAVNATVQVRRGATLIQFEGDGPLVLSYTTSPGSADRSRPSTRTRCEGSSGSQDRSVDRTRRGTRSAVLLPPASSTSTPRAAGR